MIKSSGWPNTLAREHNREYASSKLGQIRGFSCTPLFLRPAQLTRIRRLEKRAA